VFLARLPVTAGQGCGARVGTIGVMRAIGHWRTDAGMGGPVVTQLGFTPTFRYWPGGAQSGWFYEAAVGPNLLSPIYRRRQENFSTAFSFRHRTH